MEDAAQHVKYEIEMMIATVDEIARGEWSSPTTTIAEIPRTIAMESFLLHFRNLREFLWPIIGARTNAPCEDDVLGSDFLGRPTHENICAVPAIAEGNKERLDKLLAHISYQRSDYTAKGMKNWKICEMAVAVLDGFDVFIEEIPEEDMRSWFPNRQELKQKRSGFNYIAEAEKDRHP